MNYKWLSEILRGQLAIAEEQNKQQSEQIRILLESNQSLVRKVEELTQSIKNLEQALIQKESLHERSEKKAKTLARLLSSPSEKIKPETPEVSQPVAPTPKQRGNNGAKRKEHFDLEEVIEDVYPDQADFDINSAHKLSYTDSVRYEYYPSRFVKHIYRLHTCSYNDKLYAPHAPATPLFNSSYEASFIAGLLHLRYGYNMPVERIVNLFTECGFELPKATAHGLIKKTAQLLSPVQEALRATILTDTYLSMDESFHRVLCERSVSAKGSRKGYIWAALANNLNLVELFYNKGSRGAAVVAEYIPTTYQGAIQSDAYIAYKKLEQDGEHLGVTRLGCFQHCKRKFLDLEDPRAKEIVEKINKLYRIEHKMFPGWSKQKKVAYRQKEATPVLCELKEKLHAIVDNPDYPPGTSLHDAASYMLNQYDVLLNYLIDADYRLDNNAIERIMRYISLSRKNSLFFGSDKGAENSTLLFSLACSCRLNKVNIFEYFTDILNKLISIPPNAPLEAYRELLPDRWKKG